MRGKRARMIRKLVAEEDPKVLLCVRKYYGSATEQMDMVAIYRAAKKLYNQNKFVM